MQYFGRGVKSSVFRMKGSGFRISGVHHVVLGTLPSEEGSTKREFLPLAESQSQDPTLTVLHVPYSHDSGFISQRVFIKSFCKSPFPHKSVNLFFILVTIKDKLTNLCGN